MLRARDQDGGGPGLAEDVAGRGGDIGVGSDRHAAGQCEFLEVGRDAGRSEVAGEVAALGVDEDGDGAGAGQGDQVGGDGRAHDALAVVGEQDGAGALDGGGGGLHQVLLFLGLEGEGAFLVGADDLLRGCHVAAFADGGAGGGGDEGGDDAGYGGGEAADGAAGVVVGEQSDQDGAAAEGGDVVGDVAAAAQHLAGFAQADHGDRRLGRDAVDIAAQEAVEHDVADAQDGDTGEIECESHSGWIEQRGGGVKG